MSFKYLKKNKDGIATIIRDKEQIRKDFTTQRYKIEKPFLDFIEDYSYLWTDPEIINGYLITPLKNDLLKLEYEQNPQSKHMALQCNITQSYLIDIALRMANEQNLIQTLSGDTGSGKSFSGVNSHFFLTNFVKTVLGKEPSYTKDNIVFSRSEVVDLTPKLKTYECCQLDEDNESVLGIGSFAEKSKVNRFEKTLRSMQKNFNNCSPNVTNHNEHYIFECSGVNDTILTNKVLLRERGKLWQGFIILPSNKSKEYNILINDYKNKKLQFQKDLENNKGDDKRLIRILEMAVHTIQKYKLNITLKNMFLTVLNTEYVTDTQSLKELKNIMLLLLDSRNEMFKTFKDQIKEFIIPYKEKSIKEIIKENKDEEED